MHFPLLEVLIDDKFLKHSDVSIKFNVAYLMCELTRIMTSDIPDENIFELIISTFRLLSYWTRQTYIKEILILKIVAIIKLYLM